MALGGSSTRFGSASSAGGATLSNAPPQMQQAALATGCPAGSSTVSKSRQGGGAYGCPPGATENSRGTCCQPAAAAAGGGMGASFTLPSMGAGAGGAAFTPTAIARPNLTPIKPEAAYDPEIANTLAAQRSHVGDLKSGTGFAMDVLTQGVQDQAEAELQQAKASAIAQGIPFDEAAFRSRALQSRNKAMAQEKLGRESMVGAALSEEGAQARGLAGERTQRLDLDLRRDVSENELGLDLYGKDIAKYSADAQAAVSANNALLDFYSKLTSGMFASLGNLGTSNLSSSVRIG